MALIPQHPVAWFPRRPAPTRARTRRPRPVLLPLLLGLAGWLAASPLAAQALPGWVAVDSAARQVTLELVAMRTPAGQLALNGERDNTLQLVVPKGWTLTWHWRNADSTAKRSLIVMVEREKLPEQAGRPAFTNAVTRSPVAGLPVGATDVSTFELDEAGWYWILGGVPTHAIQGEVIGLKVDASARTVSIVRKGA